jgi:hypothetical protein
MKKRAPKISTETYKSLKKYLDGYVGFSFKSPRKGKDFTPAQKRAITIKYKKYGDIVKKVKLGEIKFLRKRVKGFLNTKKGSFATTPEAVVKVSRETIKEDGGTRRRAIKLTYVETRLGRRREWFFSIPTKYLTSLDGIEKYVEFLREKFKPDYVRLAFFGQKASEVYTPGKYKLYGGEMNFEARQLRKAKDGAIGNIVGVYLGWKPEN